MNKVKQFLLVIVLPIFFIIFLVGCTGSEVAKEQLQMYKEANNHLINRVLVFQNQKYTVANKKFSSLTTVKGPKILIIVGTDCSPCIDRFIEWNEFLQTGKLNDINVLFIAEGRSNEYFETNINKYDFRFNILLDEESTFLDENKLIAYQKTVFLLDSENRVLLVGNPIGNKTILDYYNYEIKQIR